MSLSTPRAGFARQAWFFLHLHRRQWKLGDIVGLMWRRGLLRGRTSAEAWRHSGTDVAPRSLAWQACHFQHLGLDLRGRRGALCTTIDVSGSLATFWD